MSPPHLLPFATQSPRSKASASTETQRIPWFATQIASLQGFSFHKNTKNPLICNTNRLARRLQLPQIHREFLDLEHKSPRSRASAFHRNRQGTLRLGFRVYCLFPHSSSHMACGSTNLMKQWIVRELPRENIQVFGKCKPHIVKKSNEAMYQFMYQFMKLL